MAKAICHNICLDCGDQSYPTDRARGFDLTISGLDRSSFGSCLAASSPFKDREAVPFVDSPKYNSMLTYDLQHVPKEFAL